MAEIVRSQVATAPDTRIACVRSYEFKAALMRELSVTVLIGWPETTHNSSSPADWRGDALVRRDDAPDLARMGNKLRQFSRETGEEQMTEDDLKKVEIIVNAAVIAAAKALMGEIVALLQKQLPPSTSLLDQSSK